LYVQADRLSRNRRQADSAAAAAAAGRSAAAGENGNTIEQHLYCCEAVSCPPALRNELQMQWTKVLKRQQKAAEVGTTVIYPNSLDSGSQKDNQELAPRPNTKPTYCA
jgi:hypothetical protein